MFSGNNTFFSYSLKDEDKDVHCKARKLWEQVGHKYEEENMDQLKQEIDFDVAITDYPPGGENQSNKSSLKFIYHVICLIGKVAG